MIAEDNERLHSELGSRVRRSDGNRLSRILMASFPCSVGRVDWRKARSVAEKPAPASRSLGANVGEDSLQTAQYVEEVIAFFTECVRLHSFSDDWVAFVGDSMDHEYEVEMSSVPELLRIVSEVPDHKSIFSLHGV